MANAGSIFSTTLPGAREDLADWIAIADMAETGFLSSISRGARPTNMRMQWLTDNYDTPDINGVPEGVDAADYGQIGRQAVLNGLAQRWWVKVKVTKEAQDVMDQAGVGVKGLLARQLNKAMFKQLPRNMEATFLSFARDCQVTSSTIGGQVIYQTRGMGQWCSATAQATFPVDPSYRPNAAQNNTTATGSLTETGATNSIASVTKSIFDNGSKAKIDVIFIAGSALKQALATLTITETNATNTLVPKRRIASEAGELKNTIEIIENEFVRAQVKLSPWISFDQSTYSTFRGYIYDPKMIELRFAQLPQVMATPDLGGGPRAIVDAIAGLVVKNPLTLASFGATS